MPLHPVVAFLYPMVFSGSIEKATPGCNTKISF